MSRDAFWGGLIYEHRSPSTQITGTAFDSSRNRLYLGLSDGHIEEYRLDLSTKRPPHLSARKSLCNQPIHRISCLPSLRCLAVQCAGQLRLIECDSLDGEQISGAKGVTAFDVLLEAADKPIIAIATRHNRRDAWLMLYSLSQRTPKPRPGQGAACIFRKALLQGAAVKDLSWIGRKLVYCTALEYILLNLSSGQEHVLLTIQEDAISRTLIAAFPGSQQALLLMERVGVVVDDSGHPVLGAFTFPAWPSALVVTGGFVLAVCGNAVHVYDTASSALLQTMPLAGNQQIPTGTYLNATKDRASSHVLVQSPQKIWLIRPIAVEDQAKQLLHAGNYTAFKALAKEGADSGAAWANLAFAEAGFKFLQENFFHQAMDAFLAATPATFQPSTLFPLFPELTRPWDHCRGVQQYWTLHAVLPPLPELLSRHLNRRSPLFDEELCEAERCVVQYLAKVREASGVNAKDGVDCLLAVLLSKLQMRGPLEDLMHGPNHVRLHLVEDCLRARGDLHALALLLAHNGQVSEALDLWKDVIEKSGLRDMSALSSYKEWLGSEEIGLDLLLRHFVWLLGVLPASALSVVKKKTLDQGQVLRAIKTHQPELAWEYLEHLVGEQGSKEPAHHTELAVLLTELIGRKLPESHLREPAWHQANTVLSDGVQKLRTRLRQHLVDSTQYDAPQVLAALSGKGLFQEEAIVLEKAGEIEAALRIHALVLDDTRSAQALCQKVGSKEAHMLLLKMLLHPPDGRPAKYVEACRVLASPGVTLDPMRVVETLADDMPLAYAGDIFARMLCERLHRHRQALILRNLHRSVNLSAAAERAEFLSKKIVVRDSVTCGSCHARLGNKMFWVYPNGSLACYKCAMKGEE